MGTIGGAHNFCLQKSRMLIGRIGIFLVLEPLCLVDSLTFIEQDVLSSGTHFQDFEDLGMEILQVHLDTWLMANADRSLQNLIVSVHDTLPGGVIIKKLRLL